MTKKRAVKPDNPFLKKRLPPVSPAALEHAIKKGAEDARELDKHIRDSFTFDPRRDNFRLD